MGVTQAGRMNVNLYSTSGVIPGKRLFTQGVRLPATGTEADWFGGTGLNWFIQPGTYWVTFEVPLSPDSAFAFMLEPSPHPLSRYAVRRPLDPANWFNVDASTPQFTPLSLGVRIEGNALSQTPEPDSILLVGLGAMCALFMRFRRYA